MHALHFYSQWEKKGLGLRADLPCALLHSAAPTTTAAKLLFRDREPQRFCCCSQRNQCSPSSLSFLLGSEPLQLGCLPLSQHSIQVARRVTCCRRMPESATNGRDWELGSSHFSEQRILQWSSCRGFIMLRVPSQIKTGDQFQSSVFFVNFGSKNCFHADDAQKAMGGCYFFWHCQRGHKRISAGLFDWFVSFCAKK